MTTCRSLRSNPTCTTCKRASTSAAKGFCPIQISHMAPKRSCFCWVVILSLITCSKASVPSLRLGHNAELLTLLKHRIPNVGI
ncbi:hypothetical protein ES319_D07G132400v1 [Gossypium barbadense]|uniref:Uncharacterized protein n=1 Tax=Gossypium barbadense TaxID=3634 RepID=A0A5J5QSE3_GOSBA|nr:hypothetical protein ES319_D07G132400v1 [Gossypium barbadense]